MTLHLILVFMIGIFVGISLISESDKIVSQMTSRIEKQDQIYTGMNNSYLQDYKLMQNKYDQFKRYIYNGSELRCVEM